MSECRTIDLVVAAPRGFCAGVERAIKIVETALDKYGPPVYVRHEIVHNKFVVDGLRERGAVFVHELEEVPDGVPVIFSAHGVPKAVPEKAESRGMHYIDATCPLVFKVHRQAERMVKDGRHILFIGHAGHPEVVGTFGQVPEGTITLIESVEDAEAITPPDGPLGFLTQTTLSVDDTSQIVRKLKERFPDIIGPKSEDICYATSNRQEAVKAMSRDADLVLVIGAPNSSNSQRLREVAENAGVTAKLIQTHKDIDWSWFEGVHTVGLTAGASAPEILVRWVIEALNQHFDVTQREVRTRTEDVTFKLPRELVAD